MLCEKGTLAIKQVRGSLGEGFYKVELAGESALVNGVPTPVEGLCAFVSGLEGYIVTEYLRPHPSMCAFCPNTANTVRYLVGNDGGSPVFLKAFVRFGTRQSGFVENYNSGGVMCFVDAGGSYEYGNQIDPDTRLNRIIERHPDTGVRLKGSVPLWDGMVEAASRFCRAFPQLTYLGFDFVATEGRGVRMLEINSLSSLDAIQLDCSLYDTPNGWWFRERLGKLR